MYIYICVSAIHFVSVSTTFRLGFETVTTLWYFFGFPFYSQYFLMSQIKKKNHLDAEESSFI